MHSPNNMAGPELLPKGYFFFRTPFFGDNTNGLTEWEPLAPISSLAVKQTAFYIL